MRVQEWVKDVSGFQCSRGCGLQTALEDTNSPGNELRDLNDLSYHASLPSKCLYGRNDSRRRRSLSLIVTHWSSVHADKKEKQKLETLLKRVDSCSWINVIIYLIWKNLPTALIPRHFVPQPQLAHHNEILAWDGHCVQEVDDATVELGVHHLCELIVQGLAENKLDQKLYIDRIHLDHFARWVLLTWWLHFPVSSTHDSCRRGPSSRLRMRWGGRRYSVHRSSLAPMDLVVEKSIGTSLHHIRYCLFRYQSIKDTGLLKRHTF